MYFYYQRQTKDTFIIVMIGPILRHNVLVSISQGLKGLKNCN